MRTNIVLDDTLITEAFRLTGIKTKRELILQALKEMVDNRKRLDLRDLKGTGGLHRGYDYKALRANEGGK